MGGKREVGVNYNFPTRPITAICRLISLKICAHENRVRACSTNAYNSHGKRKTTSMRENLCSAGAQNTNGKTSYEAAFVLPEHEKHVFDPPSMLVIAQHDHSVAQSPRAVKLTFVTLEVGIGSMTSPPFDWSFWFESVLL